MKSRTILFFIFILLMTPIAVRAGIRIISDDLILINETSAAAADGNVTLNQLMRLLRNESIYITGSSFLYRENNTRPEYQGVVAPADTRIVLTLLIANNTFFQNDSSLVPNTNNTFNIGSLTLQYDNLYQVNIRSSYVVATINFTAPSYLYPNGTRPEYDSDTHIDISDLIGNNTFIQNNTVDDLFNYSRIDLAGNLSFDSIGQGISLDTDEGLFMDQRKVFYNGTCTVFQGSGGSSLSIC